MTRARSSSVTILAVVFLLYLTPQVLAYSDAKIIFIPEKQTVDRPFLVCARNVDYTCAPGTEHYVLYYPSDSSTGVEMRDINEFFSGVPVNFTSEYKCALVNKMEYEDYNYPPTSTGDMLQYYTGTCYIDEEEYLVYPMEYDANHGEFRVSIQYPNGTVIESWMKEGTKVVVDSSKNAWVKLVNVRQINGLYHLNFSCDSDHIKKIPQTLVRVEADCMDVDYITSYGWNMSEYLEVGNLSVDFSPYTLEQLASNKTVGSTLLLQVSVTDNNTPVSADVIYGIRGPDGFVKKQGVLKYNSTSGWYETEVNVSRDWTVGIIEADAVQYDNGNPVNYGGSYTPFWTVPFYVDVLINNSEENESTFFIMDQIPIRLVLDNFYGNITSVKTKIIYEENTTRQWELNITEDGDEEVFTIPGDGPGWYTVDVAVEHSTLDYTYHYTKRFYVNGYELVVNVDEMIPLEGEVRVSAYLKDMRWSRPVFAKITAIDLHIVDPNGNELPYNLTAEYMGMVYVANSTLTNSSPMGRYTVTVRALDPWGYVHEANRTFLVNKGWSNQYIEVTPPPTILVTNTTTQEYNVTVKNVYPADIYNINISIANATYNNGTHNVTAPEFLDCLELNTSQTNTSHLKKDETTRFWIVLTPTEKLENGEYALWINATVGNLPLIFPVYFNISILPNITFYPSDIKWELEYGKTYQKEWMIANEGWRTAKNMSPIKSTSLYNLVEYDDLKKDLKPHTNITITLRINTSRVVLGENETLPKTITGWIGARYYNTENNTDVHTNLTIVLIENLEPRIARIDKELEDLAQKIISLNTSAHNYKVEMDVSDLIEKKNILRQNLTTATMIYGENYTRARELLDEIEKQLETLNTTYQAKYQEFLSRRGPIDGDGVCEPTEPCSSNDCKLEPRCLQTSTCGNGKCDVGDCGKCEEECPENLRLAYCHPEELENQKKGGGLLFIILGVIVGLIVGAVLVTSLVPEEGE